MMCVCVHAPQCFVFKWPSNPEKLKVKLFGG